MAGLHLSGQALRGGVVEDDAGRQREFGGGIEPVAQLHGHDRVETLVLERPVDLDVRRIGAQDQGGLRTDEVERGDQRGGLLSLRLGVCLPQRGDGRRGAVRA
ncbi:hypothetical protein GCM10010294_58110 [Streptomyces griseoloalbus]|nr:hypothetical protein GCM10010294_58110 [Streptomyces griseoloalbus]